MMTQVGDVREDDLQVTPVRRLYERFQQLIHEGAKFGVIGAVGFVVTDGGTNLLHFQAGLGPNTANVLATIVATFVTYAGNRYWTFRNREGSTMVREYVVFFVLNGIGLAIQLACISFTYYLLGLHDKLAYNIALIVGIALGTLFRFWSYRKWVWFESPRTVAEADDGQPPYGPGVPGHPLGLDHVTGNGNANGLLHANGKPARDEGARSGPRS